LAALPAGRNKTPWLAPELFQDLQHQPSQKCDIYQLGIVLIEAAGAEKPFRKLPVKDSFSSDLYDFVFKCTDLDPTKRPSVNQLLSHSFMANVTPDSSMLLLAPLYRPDPIGQAKQLTFPAFSKARSMSSHSRVSSAQLSFASSSNSPVSPSSNLFSPSFAPNSRSNSVSSQSSQSLPTSSSASSLPQSFQAIPSFPPSSALSEAQESSDFDSSESQDGRRPQSARSRSSSHGSGKRLRRGETVSVSPTSAADIFKKRSGTIDGSDDRSDGSESANEPTIKLKIAPIRLEKATAEDKFTAEEVRSMVAESVEKALAEYKEQSEKIVRERVSEEITKFVKSIVAPLQQENDRLKKEVAEALGDNSRLIENLSKYDKTVGAKKDKKK